MYAHKVPLRDGWNQSTSSMPYPNWMKARPRSSYNPLPFLLVYIYLDESIRAVYTTSDHKTDLVYTELY